MKTPHESLVESHSHSPGAELQIVRVHQSGGTSPYAYRLDSVMGNQRESLAYTNDPCAAWHWSLKSKYLLSPREWADKIVAWFQSENQDETEWPLYARALDELGSLHSEDAPPLIRRATGRLQEAASWVINRIPGDDLGYDLPESLPRWHPGHSPYRLQEGGIGNWSDPGPWSGQRSTAFEYLRPASRQPATNATCSCRTSPGISLPALRRTIASRSELLETLEAGERKATGRIGANVALMWKLSMSSLYSSADVPVLAARECLQNSADSLREAIRTKAIRREDAEFLVDWEPDKRTIHFEDSGLGMDQQTILEKFLVLGESGKRKSGGSAQVGGFGIAKAVILGCSSTFRWELTTRNNRVVSHGPDQEIEVFEHQPYVKGCIITVFDVASTYDWWWDSAGGGRRPLELRLKELLAANDLPDITVRYNGDVVHPLFSRRGGSKIEVRAPWGDGTTASVKAYKRSDRRGAYWIRLNGLLQFRAGSNGDLGVDVVVDLTTSIRPGEPGYPLNAGRDAFQGVASSTFRALVESVERENLSTGNQQEDEVFDAEGEPEADLSDDLGALARSFADDPALADLLKDDREHTASSESDPESQAPSADESVPEGGNDSSTPGHPPTGPVIKTNLPDDYVLDLTKSRGRIPWLPPGLQTPDAIRKALDQAEEESPYEMSQEAIDALNQVRTGKLTVGQLKTIAQEMDRAARTVAKYKGNDIQVRPAPKETRGARNPFGHLGALRVSKVNYPKERARAFRRNPRKWLPYLLLWRATLKLMAETAGIARPIQPGFVLEDGTIGLAQKRNDSSPTVIYIHPDRLAEVADANGSSPIGIAGFLHGVGAHELTHCDGRMGEGHSEAYISAREDLGRRTAHLMPRLAQLAVKLLKLPEPTDELAAKVVRLEKQLAQTREGRELARTEKRKLEKQLLRELAQCQDQVTMLADAASKRARAACTGACSVAAVPGVPERVEADPAAAGQPDAPSSRAVRVVSAVHEALMAAPPVGIEREYIDRFFLRYQRRLAQVVDARLPARGLEG